MGHGNCGLGLGSVLMGMDRCGVYGFVQVGGFHHAMGFGCSYSGVGPGRRVFKIPFDKRQDTG